MPKLSAKTKRKTVIESSGPETPLVSPKNLGKRDSSQEPKISQVKVKGNEKVAPAKDAIANNPKKRGLNAAKHEEASLTNTVRDAVIKELPKSAKNQVKIKTVSIKTPESGWGVLTANGKPVGPSQSPELKAYGKVSMGESKIIDGTVEVLVGGKVKAKFDAASPKLIAGISESYARLGREVNVRVNRRNGVTTDKKLGRKILESIHARHHNMPDIAKDLSREALIIAKNLLESEYNPFFFESKKDWIDSCVKPTFRALKESYRASYEDALEAFEVIVRVEKNGEDQDYCVMANALNEEHAAAAAKEAIIEEVGPSFKPVHAMVGSKKFLPEQADTASLFSKAPTYFKDMPDASMGTKASKDGSTAENKPKSPEKAKYGSGTTKGVSRANHSSNSGGNAEKHAKRDGGETGSAKVHAKSELEPAKDSGPIYEDLDLSDKIRKAARESKDSSKSEKLEAIADKLDSGAFLTGKEAQIVDFFA